MLAHGMVGEQIDLLGRRIGVEKGFDLFHFILGVVDGGDDGNADPDRRTALQ